MCEKAGRKTSLGIYEVTYTVRCSIIYHTTHWQSARSLNTWSLAGLIHSGIVSPLYYNTEDSQYIPLGTLQQHGVCTV